MESLERVKTATGLIVYLIIVIFGAALGQFVFQISTPVFLMMYGYWLFRFALFVEGEITNS